MLVVIASDWIGSGDDRTPGIESRDDACFGDGDGLLFHGLVDGGPVLLGHLVELIDQADSLVSQYHCSSLEPPLLGRRVHLDRGSQSNRSGSFACGVDTPGEHLLDTFQHLGFADAWIPKQQNIQIPSYPMGILLVVLLLTSKQSQGDCSFDSGVPVDRRDDRVVQTEGKILFLCKLLELQLVDSCAIS